MDLENNNMYLLLNMFTALEPPIDKVKRCDQDVHECEQVCEDIPTGIKCSCFDGFRAKGSSCIGNPRMPQLLTYKLIHISHFYIFWGKVKLTFRHLIFPCKILTKNRMYSLYWLYVRIDSLSLNSPVAFNVSSICQFCIYCT